jgi:hypothetical protein
MTGTEVLSQRRKAGIRQGEIRDDCPLGEATGPPSLYDVSRQQHNHPHYRSLGQDPRLRGDMAAES